MNTFFHKGELPTVRGGRGGLTRPRNPPPVGPGTRYALGLTPTQYLRLWWRVKEYEIAGGDLSISVAVGSLSATSVYWVQDPPSGGGGPPTYHTESESVSIESGLAEKSMAFGVVPEGALSPYEVTIPNGGQSILFTRDASGRGELGLLESPGISACLDEEGLPPAFPVSASLFVSEGDSHSDSTGGSSPAGANSFAGAWIFQLGAPLNGWLASGIFLDGKVWMPFPVQFTLRGLTSERTDFTSAESPVPSTQNHTKIRRTQAVIWPDGLWEAPDDTPPYFKPWGYGEVESNEDYTSQIALPVTVEILPGDTVTANYKLNRKDIDDEGDGPDSEGTPDGSSPSITFSPPSITVRPKKWWALGGKWNESTGELV